MVQLQAGQSELEAIGAAKSGLLSSLEECLGKEPGSLNRRDDKGRTCLHYAANYGFESCLDALMSRPELETDARDKAGDTALHLAAVNGFPMCAFNLTKAAPQTCLIANKAGQTAIDVAVSNDRGEVLNAMLLACAGINSPEALKSISALLEAGAVPDTWAPNGSSALMLAAAVDSVDALQVLLKNGATVELQDALGRTALMFAAGSGAIGALKALLDAGASMAARDRRSKGILDYAPPDSPVRTILEDRLKELEAAAEQLQAALLASLDEESNTKQQAAAKSKRKGGKKGKRPKKNTGSMPPAEPIAECAEEEEEETRRESAEAQEAAQSRPSDEQSGSESDSTTGYADKEQAAAAASASAETPLQREVTSDARASTSEDEEEWKVVGKAARKLHGKGGAAAIQQATTPQPQLSSPPPLQQPTGTATPPQQRPAPYKRCPSATSLSDSSCSAESEQSMPGRGQAHQHASAQQPQQSASPHAVTLGQPVPARLAAAAAQAATPPKPGPPRQSPEAGSAQPASKAGLASAASPSGRPVDSRHLAAGPSSAATQESQRVSYSPEPNSWAGKVAGTPAKPPDPRRPSLDGQSATAASQFTTSQPSRCLDPPCAKPQQPVPGLSHSSLDTSSLCHCGPVGRAVSLPTPDAAPQQVSVAAEELANARADAAAARRETLLLAAEVDRLRTALAHAEASRQLEITQLLQNAAHHESMAIEEAVRQEKAAMTARLLSAFESMKGLNGTQSQPMTPTGATTPHKGLMGTLLDVQPGTVVGSRTAATAPVAFPTAATAPFSAFGSPPSAGLGISAAPSLGVELSSLLSGMGGTSSTAFHLPMEGAVPGACGPEVLGRAAGGSRPAAEPFSFFNGASSIWK
ncbi:probable Ankycorbin at N-terminal half [Coccomyxa sp. Obi]|nr:probable Ankycorbin at N-terminal half [Coccomyxa sp. Obi]